MKTKIFFFLIFFLLPQITCAAVIFEDNFDSQANWGPVQPNGGEATLTPPTGWSDAWHSFSVFYSSYGEKGQPTFNIKGGTGFTYGDTGKAFVYYNESGSDNECGPSVWCSDGILGISLVGTNYTQGYDDIYIGMRMKLQSGWTWAISNPLGGFIKILHASHYGGGNLHDFHSDAENKPRFVPVLQWEPDWDSMRLYTLLSVLPSTNTVTTYYNPGNQSSAGEGDPGETPGCTFGTAGCFQTNTWHTVIYRLKMNTGQGASDGIMQIWIDGFLEASKTNIPWMQTYAPSTRGWNHVWLGGNNYNQFAPLSSRAEQWYALDNFIVATTKTEVDSFLSGGGGGDTTPPAAPSGLLIT